MTTRQQIDDTIAEWGTADRPDLPDWLRNPKTEDEFALSLALLLHGTPDTSPIYEDDILIGFRGIGLKDKS